MGERVKLRILGLTYSQAQTGSYALVLAEDNGERRIPIMIGAFEAQAIALHLEELHPPRPLTHDLFRSFAKSYSIELKEVFINKLEEGIFYSELVFYNGEAINVIPPTFMEMKVVETAPGVRGDTASGRVMKSLPRQ